MSFLTVEDLHINLGEFYLKEVFFQLDQGDYLTIIGPTGAGKTILLESLIGFWAPDKGRIYLEGKEITKEPPEHRRIGIVYQDYALLPHFSVFKNIAYGLKKKYKHGIEERVRDIASALCIDHLLHRKPATLSGGEQQRVALARALVAEPKLLLMDEPFSALDSRTRRDTRLLVKRAIKERHTTVIHVTHDLIDAWFLANKVAVFREGHLLQFGPLDEVFTRPRSEFIADFVGVTMLEGRVKAQEHGLTVIGVDGIDFRSLDEAGVGSDVTLAIRPEDIIVSRGPLEQVSVQNRIEALLEDIVPEGKTSLLRLRAHDMPLSVLVTRNALHQLQLAPGDMVWANIKSANVRIVRDPIGTDIEPVRE